MRKKASNLLLLMLAGCASNDSLSDKTQTPGLKKYCNPYYVRGSWHHPQPYYEYDEVGLASWYGPGFHGKPKPSGEPFNQNAYTAAHTTLPLPAVVKVTNLENGKSLVVVVDDRGPFTYKGRIIDLSKQAAKYLGFHDKGIGKVRVQSLVEDSYKLCQYLACNGNKSGRCGDGRSWEQIYHHEIKGNKDFQPISPLYATAKLEGLKPTDKMDKILTKLESDHSIKKSPSNNTPHLIFINTGKVFIDHGHALQFYQKLKTKYPGYVKTAKSTNGKVFYNIILGPFKAATAANQAVQDLQHIGLKNSIIFNQSNDIKKT